MSALVAGLAVGAALVGTLRRAPAHRLRRALPGVGGHLLPPVSAVVPLSILLRFAGVGVVPLVGFAAAVAVSAGWLRRRTAARLATGRAGVVGDVVVALAAELRAGRTPGEAFAAAASMDGPLHEPLVVAARAVRCGAGTAPEHLQSIAALPGCAALTGVAAAWEVTESAGGAVADVLDRLGQLVDADDAARRSMDAALAGPRATMTLLACLPLLGIGLGESAGADPLRLLLHRPLGWALMTAAGALELAGLLWARRIVGAAHR